MVFSGSIRTSWFEVLGNARYPSSVKVLSDVVVFLWINGRQGGASAAANAGVSDRLFKRHGRWRTDRAKDGYIKASLESLRSV